MHDRTISRLGRTGQRREAGIALIMVILTLFALLFIGIPYMVSMIGFEKASDTDRQRQQGLGGTDGAVKWALDSLVEDARVFRNDPVIDYSDADGGDKLLDPGKLPAEMNDRAPLSSGVTVTDLSGRLDANSLTLRSAENLFTILPEAFNELTGTKDDTSEYKLTWYKLLLWPFRPIANENWEATPVAPRNKYRPFRSVSAIRELSNMVKIDRGLSTKEYGYIPTTTYRVMADCLRVEQESLKSDRWINPTILTADTAVNSTTLEVMRSDGINKGSLVRIEDKATGLIEYNLCTDVIFKNGNLSVGNPTENAVYTDENKMRVSLFFNLRNTYEEGTSYLSTLRRIPVNINTASYHTLKVVLKQIEGTPKGILNATGDPYEITPTDAELIIRGIITARESAPFSAETFQEFDIAGLLPDPPPVNAIKGALVKYHARNPYDPLLTASTTGFSFSSDRNFAVTGRSAVSNTQSGLVTADVTQTMVVNLYPSPPGEVSVREDNSTGTLIYLKDPAYSSVLQSEFMTLEQNRQFLLTGPNGLSAVDIGAPGGIADIASDSSTRVSYVQPAPLRTSWNPGYHERTSFLVHFDDYSKDTVTSGDNGFGLKHMVTSNTFYRVGLQTNTGVSGAYDPSGTDGWKNDMTPDGIALGLDADGGALTEQDYLEYQLFDPGDPTNAEKSKIMRDGSYSNFFYEGISFDFWLRTDGTWDSNHYLLDVTRGDSEMPVGMDYADWEPIRDYQNRLSFYMVSGDIGTTPEIEPDILVLRIKDTAMQDPDIPAGHEYVEVKQEVRFVPGMWYHVKVMVRSGGGGGWNNTNTANQVAMFIDGKPAWKLSPAAGDTDFKYAEVNPGATIDDGDDSNNESMNPGIYYALGNAPTDTSIPVDDTSSLPDSGVVQIGRERIEYLNKTANSLENCLRGQRGTSRQVHLEGEQVTLFGYSIPLVDIDLEVGGAELLEELDDVTPHRNDPGYTGVRDMPNDNDLDQTTDLATIDTNGDLQLDDLFVFYEGEASITVTDADFTDFASPGFMEIASGSVRAIVYYTKSGNKSLSVDWTVLQTDDEGSASPLQFPQERDLTAPLTFNAGRLVRFTQISIQTTKTTQYPDSGGNFGTNSGYAYFQVHDEWIEYGRDDCGPMFLGKAADPTNTQFFFVGDGTQRHALDSPDGSTMAYHDINTDLIPCFQVSGGNRAASISNVAGYHKDKVTVISTNGIDEEFKEQMTINRSGSSSYTEESLDTGGGTGDRTVSHPMTWLAFTENVSQLYKLDTSRIVKFPSGDMPAVMTDKLTIGNSRDKAYPLKAEIDEFRLNRYGYRPAYVWDYDDQETADEDDQPWWPGNPSYTSYYDLFLERETDITAGDYFIEINRTGNSNAQIGGSNFPQAGYLRINQEVFAYTFVCDLPDIPEPYYSVPRWTIPSRFKLKLIERGCFGTRQGRHTRYASVMVLEGTPCTTLVSGGITADASRILVDSHKGFPPSGYLRIGDEIIGYAYKGTNSLSIDYFALQCTPDTDKFGITRGRFGTTPAAHAEGAFVQPFITRYPDATPVVYDAAGNEDARYAVNSGPFFKRIFRRSNTVFGLPADDPDTSRAASDLTFQVCTLNESGGRMPIPSGMQLRVLVGCGSAANWTAAPVSGNDDKPDTRIHELQEFIIGPGEGGEDLSGTVKTVTFNLGSRLHDTVEIRVYFEYLPDAWTTQDDAHLAIYDPAYEAGDRVTGALSWKWMPVIENMGIYVRGTNRIYETVTR